MQSILIITDYFGTWPKWFAMYLKSCAPNSTVHWLIQRRLCRARAKATECDVHPDVAAGLAPVGAISACIAQIYDSQTVEVLYRTAGTNSYAQWLQLVWSQWIGSAIRLGRLQPLYEAPECAFWAADKMCAIAAAPGVIWPSTPGWSATLTEFTLRRGRAA